MAKRATDKRRSNKGVAPARVYISASRQINILPIRQALANRGVKVFSPDQLDMLGKSLEQITRKAMIDADIVIAVYDSFDVGFAFYEVGFAQALRKPTVALIPKDAPVEAWIARGIPYLRLDTTATDSLDFLVNQILAAPHSSVSPRKDEGANTKPIGQLSDELLERLNVAGSSISESVLSQIVAEAVQASGVKSVSQTDFGNTRADIAVWTEDLSPWVANPLPIEIKCHLESVQTLIASSVFANNSAEVSGALWALVIYVTSSISLESGFLPHNVLVIQAGEFLKSLKKTSFGDLVRVLRNERVHGRG